MNVHDFSEKAMNGKDITLSDYKGKVLLIVNTASKCGLTPQLEGLEAMYKKLGGDHFEILGFPCNQFLHQDPGSDKAILEFCQMNYGVTFQMFSKIKVKGKDATPLYKYLTEQTGGKKIEWNFAKFLIDENGNVVERFPSKMKPEDFEDKVAALVANVK
ncbi:glutathione peroxidase [Listeria sp. FSL L7-1509]|uniref:Glutathione peroxidase n=1 Tax=Listeria immobilis TaxID=2713502 RepID=A0ABR6SRM9_9LIST|nr:glutathione peroxidase [Listeria immobilis]MBC1482958.1 glutathione peroxidase [Listeria immobilis]MBC1505886.1 glutathione peroxidase [Listeria immobilis]MBC1508323.1 glutathione peroxidase [Listeria immobilis]MBC6302981.1 glutathione peroxidase [Listeria immobilis]MBC6311245.1 glutathione peroxidase [Listeria immobilis]